MGHKTSHLTWMGFTDIPAHANGWTSLHKRLCRGGWHKKFNIFWSNFSPFHAILKQIYSNIGPTLVLIHITFYNCSLPSCNPPQWCRVTLDINPFSEESPYFHITPSMTDPPSSESGDAYFLKTASSCSNLNIASSVFLCMLSITIRDAIIKENPVKSGFLQIGGGRGSRGPPDPDFLHVNKNSRF